MYTFSLLLLGDFLEVLECSLNDFIFKQKVVKKPFPFSISWIKFQFIKCLLYISHFGDQVFYEEHFKFYQCCFRIYQDGRIIFILWLINVMKCISTHLVLNLFCILQVNMFEKLTIRKDYIYWVFTHIHSINISKFFAHMYYLFKSSLQFY